MVGLLQSHLAALGERFHLVSQRGHPTRIATACAARSVSSTWGPFAEVGVQVQDGSPANTSAPIATAPQ